MMKMTVKINKKFFESKHAFIGDSTLSVTCITCHHGKPHPENQSEGMGRSSARTTTATAPAR